jgi:hypothetical protein
MENKQKPQFYFKKCCGVVWIAYNKNGKNRYYANISAIPLKELKDHMQLLNQ